MSPHIEELGMAVCNVKLLLINRKEAVRMLKNVRIGIMYRGTPIVPIGRKRKGRISQGVSRISDIKRYKNILNFLVASATREILDAEIGISHTSYNLSEFLFKTLTALIKLTNYFVRPQDTNRTVIISVNCNLVTERKNGILYFLCGKIPLAIALGTLNESIINIKGRLHSVF